MFGPPARGLAGLAFTLGSELDAGRFGQFDLIDEPPQPRQRPIRGNRAPDDRPVTRHSGVQIARRPLMSRERRQHPPQSPHLDPSDPGGACG